MQNVEDNDTPEEEEEEEGKSWCAIPTLHPQSIFRLGWDCLILVLMIYTTVVLPMSLAEFPFMLHGAWLIIEQTVNIFFFFDLFLNLHTGYVNDQRVLVMDAHSTRINYLRTWFVPDVIATIPVDLIYTATSGVAWDPTSPTGVGAGALQAEDPALATAIKCLRLLRMFRLLRLRRILNRLEIRSGLQTSTKTAVTFAAVVFFASHWHAICCVLNSAIMLLAGLARARSG
jgi:hypothetical protein